MRISYSDSEVNVFHPVCEDALNAALKLIGKDGEYRVIHHRYTGTLEMDFCVQNIATGRYLCVVEVKRTPSDVSSMRYQYQAMSYVQTNSGNNERPFYILTNLEYANAFRYDPSRPGAYQQLLKPGLTEICRFEKNDAKEVAKKLGEYFKGVLSDFISNRYSYYSTLDDFAAHMRSVASKPKVWKSDLAVLLYEYIRGAFDAVGRNILKDVRLFHGDVEKICLEASKADFRGIFSYSPESFSPRANIDSALLSEVYAFGRQNISGDAVSGLLHQIVSEGNEHYGEVPTDLELGRIAAVLAKHISGGLGGGELICDPAAGSGNLISSAADVFGLTPKQIVANDIRPDLLELLSLRLGLCFAGTVTPENSPTVECRSIADLDSEFFKDVRVVLMNPPFVAGINCEGKKAALLDKIRRISGRRPVTSIGQMPLEGVFLELVTLLVQPGTTVACVLPKTHLMASGPEAGAIRKLISESFGLRAVFSYPGNGIFDGVTKDTCVIVGKIGQPAEYVSVISSYDSIPDIDTQMFAQVLNSELNDGFGQIMPGVVAKRAPLSELKEAASDGWRDLNSELADAVGFVNETLRRSEYLTELSERGFPIIRGRAGNNGASDLMFFDSREELYEKFKDRPGLVLKNAIRNATYDSFIVGGGDSRFLDICNTDRVLADEIVEAYMRLPAREGRQKRNVKTGEDLIKILQREARGCFEVNSVLIPRNIRTTGRVYLADRPVYVSTNFVVVTPPDEDSAAVLSTWISTVFYQVICEASSKDQEGTRKMEVGDISKTLVPDISKLPKGFIEKLKAARRGVRFTSLKSPEIRETDRLWAEFLFGDSAEAVLGRACETLSFLANRRDT